ncbi:MAG: ThuA domain-containing protein [Balneolales bacterium]
MMNAKSIMKVSLLFAIATIPIIVTPAIAQDKQVLFIAGAPSHGFGNHEHLGGSKLLAQTINDADVGVTAHVISGWPENENAFDQIDAVVIYSNGGTNHPVVDHIDEFQKVMDRGVGLVTLHYAVEVPKGEPGDRFMEWQGGYFETDWSVNPFWTARINMLPDHPVTNGVEPFEINDEWYYHMRFAEGMNGVTTILTDLPPQESLSRDDGPHSNNPYVREAVLENKEPQHVAWVHERPNKGRSFGFTGGHYHWNWANDQFRRLVTNAIVWSAHAEVPVYGIQFDSINVLELSKLTDDPVPDDWDYQEIQDRLDASN